MDMAKRSSKSSSKSTGRAKNTPSKVSFTNTKRRYGCGGKIKN